MSTNNSSYNCNDSLSDCSKNDVKSDGDTEVNINDNMTDDSRKIFVGGLSWETNEDDLKNYFNSFGEVKSCVIKLDRFTNQSRGFGFVIFDSEDSVNKVLDHKEHILNKKKIDPKKAKPSREPQKKVFIGGLDPDMPESKIKEYFSQFGEIQNIETPFDARKNKRKRYLFITFASEAEARKAANQESQDINGKKFEVRVAIPRDQANRSKNYSGWKYPNNSLCYNPYMLPYVYQDYLCSYLYSNPYNYYNPYDYINYDFARQFQTGLMLNNSNALVNSGNNGSGMSNINPRSGGKSQQQSVSASQMQQQAAAMAAVTSGVMSSAHQSNPQQQHSHFAYHKQQQITGTHHNSNNINSSEPMVNQMTSSSTNILPNGIVSSGAAAQTANNPAASIVFIPSSQIATCTNTSNPIAPGYTGPTMAVGSTNQSSSNYFESNSGSKNSTANSKTMIQQQI